MGRRLLQVPLCEAVTTARFRQSPYLTCFPSFARTLSNLNLIIRAGMDTQLNANQTDARLVPRPIKKDFFEFYAMMALMSPRYWHRLAAFVGARVLRKLHLPAKQSVVLPFRVVNACATPSSPCGLGFFVENAYGHVYSSFVTSPGNAVLFDVGANAGFVSLIRCRQNPRLRAICFEPHPDTFRALERNIAVNNLQDRVLALNAAVGAESGELRILQAEGDSMLAVTSERLHPGVPRKEIMVPVVSLDDYCEQHNIWPDFLKIDVEGHEEQVLLGAHKVLDRVQRLVMEFHSEILKNSCGNLLRAHGFSLMEQGSLWFGNRPRPA